MKGRDLPEFVELRVLFPSTEDAIVSGGSCCCGLLERIEVEVEKIWLLGRKVESGK